MTAEEVLNELEALLDRREAMYAEVTAETGQEFPVILIETSEVRTTLALRDVDISETRDKPPDSGAH